MLAPRLLTLSARPFTVSSMLAVLLSFVPLSAAQNPSANRTKAPLTKLDIRSGLWEVTTLIDTDPDGSFAKADVKPRVTLECMTREDFEAGALVDASGPTRQCSSKVTEDTPTLFEQTTLCFGDGRTHTGTTRFESHSPGELQISGHMSDVESGKTTNSAIVFKAKWLGSSCR
jgi:hypothetical protein